MEEEKRVSEQPIVKIKQECVCLYVPRDVWNLIAQYLTVRDLLNIRQTCTLLNKYVIGMQSRWYRAHQWYVSLHVSKTKVKSAVRVHNHAVCIQCMPYEWDYPGRPEHLKGNYPRNYANRVTIQAGFQKAIDDGVFTEAQCINRYHFITKVPSSELDIPLDKFFKPKRNNYIYHYLIQCYRTKKPEHTLIINQSAMKIKTMRQQIVQSQNFIRQCEKSIIETEKKLQDEQKKYLKNDIFAGYQINTYKSPARMKLKQQEELKPKKKQKKDTEIKKQ